MIVYDYSKQEAERDMEISEAGVGVPSDLLLMENENILVVADAQGLHPIDVEESAIAEKCL